MASFVARRRWAIASTVAALAIAVGIGGTAGALAGSAAIQPARVISLLQDIRGHLVAADEIDGEVQALPAPAQLRSDDTGLSRSSLEAADSSVSRARRSGDHLVGLVNTYISRLLSSAGGAAGGVARMEDDAAAALERARTLLLGALSALRHDGEELVVDSRAAPARAGATGDARSAGSPRARAAAGPPVGTPAVVSVGDSYISGEGGRWAGNSNGSSSDVDALGPDAYYPQGAHAEEIAGCHRSRSAEIHIGAGVISKNLACSGATTATHLDEGLLKTAFKPGLDFYSGNGREGQALQLEGYAETHNVRMVVMSIGGNDFKFSTVIKTCLFDFLESTVFKKFYCKDDSSVTDLVSPAQVAERQAAILAAMTRIERAMTRAGYSSSQWTLVVQSYPAPLPAADALRYQQFGYTRQTTGGCGVWNADVDWARDHLLAKVNEAVGGATRMLNTQLGAAAANAVSLDLQPTYAGHELCSRTTQLISDWRAPGAVRESEWFAQIRTLTTLGAYQLQEGLHPNYWGQLAVRNCLRQLWNGGGVGNIPAGSVASCQPSLDHGTGLNEQREPVVNLNLRASGGPARTAVSP